MLVRCPGHLVEDKYYIGRLRCVDLGTSHVDGVKDDSKEMKKVTRFVVMHGEVEGDEAGKVDGCG